MSNYITQAEKATYTSVNDLQKKVQELIDTPLNVWAVAATIESLGIREIDARQDYGFESIFDLAEQIYSDINKEKAGKGSLQQTIGVPKLDDSSFWEELTLFLHQYSKGLLFSLPMLSQIAAIFIFRYSLWAWLDFNEAQATAVALGTIGAFVLTGGFIQIMGRSATQYIREENYTLAKKVTQKTVMLGIACITGATVLFYLINVLIPFYPQSMMRLGLTYMFLISLLMLGSAVLYALERRISILVIILLGTAIVIYNMDGLSLGIYYSQWIALLATTFLLFGYAYFYLWVKTRKNKNNHSKYFLPNAEVSYYINYRYFIYGAVYFAFLFLDRLLAWSAGESPPPFIIWFNTPYELGMDWAILSLVFSIAVLEYSVHSFSKKILRLQKKADFSQIKAFNQYYNGFYLKQLGILFGMGILSVVITYFSVTYLIEVANIGKHVPEIRDFFANPMTTKVFWIASISYLFLNVGLLHCLFFFTLNKVKYALYAIVLAFAVNLAVGFVCSRIIALEYATLGLLAGSLTFAIVSGWLVQRFFKNLDYYYYSAF